VRNDEVSFEILRIKLDPETVERVKERVRTLNTDVSTFVKWCIHTGLFLEDVNAFVRSKEEE
jgi:hypothetical protein